MKPQHEILITPGQGPLHYWRDIWRYRELFFFLVWRDILVRYKQTAIGIAWSLLRPLATMAVFSVVFGRFAGLPSHGIPYPVMVFAGMLPWQFFANALTESGNSLVDNGQLLTKVYFPRLIIPAGSVLVSLVDFAISFVLLLALMSWYGLPIQPRMLFMPLMLLMAATVSFGFGLCFAALNVKYRDFRYVLPFLVQFGLYVSPVGFASSVVPASWRDLYFLNPMVGVIDGFRWALLGDAFPVYWSGFWCSALLGLAVLAVGIAYFRRTECGFADVV